MDPINQFQSKEADKLTAWVTQTLALKEAKVHTSDAMAAIGQRAQVQVETSEMPDSIIPPTGEATSQAGFANGGGLTEEEVEEMIEEALEDYVSKEFLDGKLLEYPTWEQANAAYVDWETYNGLLDTLENDYAKKEWVDEQLEAYAKTDWVNEKLLEYPTWEQANAAYVDWQTYGGLLSSFEFEQAVGNIIQAKLGFQIQCNGDGTVTGQLTWAG